MARRGEGGEGGRLKGGGEGRESVKEIREEVDRENGGGSEEGMKREEGGEVRERMEGSSGEGGKRRASMVLGEVAVSEQVEKKAEEGKGGTGSCVRFWGMFFSSWRLGL